MAIPSGLACDSFSTFPLIGCCPPIVSTIWGVGVIAIAGGSAPTDFEGKRLSYGRVSSFFEEMRNIVNNWPEPMEESTEPNTVKIWSYQGFGGAPFERASLTNPFGVCGEDFLIVPFVNYAPFAAIKHEPQMLDLPTPSASYYYAGAMRVKVAINQDIPQIRRKTVFGTSFSGSCGFPGHLWFGHPDGHENFVVEEDVIINNPGTIEMLVPAPFVPHTEPLNQGVLRPMSEISRVRATILSLP